MKNHDYILLLFLVLAIFLAGLFIWVFQSSKSTTTNLEGMKRPLHKRFLLFLTFIVFLTLAYTITIPKSPYFLFANEVPSKLVYVLAQQYSFTLSFSAIDPNSPKSDEIELPLNEIIEFRVSSKDVNHGFAIYNDQAELITQVQAMPAYVNRLRWKFTEPGTYHVLCLEYCGMAHSFMRSSFTVK